MIAKVSAMLAPALEYAARGLHVLACRPRGKLPLTDHGLRDATTDAATITQWWTETPEERRLRIAEAGEGLAAGI